MANIIYRQMPTPREEAWVQKPQGGGKFLVQIFGGGQGGVEGGGWLWMKLIPG